MNRRTALLSSLLLPPVVSIAPVSLAYASLPEEVIVTAQKRAEPAAKIPISLTVLNQQQLERYELNHISSLTAATPNFQALLPNGSHIPVFSIRGVSMPDYNFNQLGPIGVYLDDAPLGVNYTHGLPLFDLERIEVLRGPQGTLYGKNTTGGAIKLVSKSPDFEPDGYLQLGAGSYHRRSLKAAYETPLIDQRLAARIAINTEQADGFSKNHVAGSKDLSARQHHALRLAFTLEASPDLTLWLRLNTGESDPETQAVIPRATLIPPGSSDSGVDFLSAILAAAGQDFYVRPASYSYLDADSNRVNTTEIHTDSLTFSAEWVQEAFTLYSTTGLLKGSYDHRADSDGTPQQLLEIDWYSEIDQWSQDLRISTTQTEPLAATLGVYVDQEKMDTEIIYDYYHGLRGIQPDFVAPIGGIVSGFSQVQRYQQKRSSQAVYGHLSYRFHPRSRINLGLRYTEDENTQYNVHTYITDYDRVPQFGLIPFRFPYQADAVHPQQSFTDREWSGTLKLDYELTEDNLLYGSYSRGYRSGAFNGAAVTDSSELAPVEPESVNAYELGIKGSLLANRLQYSSALFYYDYRNQQFINVVGVRQLLENAPRARLQGLELELNTQASDNLGFSFGLGVVDAEYTDGPTLHALGQPQDLTGNTLPGAPELNMTLAVDYQLAFSRFTLLTHLDANYRSEQWFTAFNDDAGYTEIGQAGYTLINGRVEINPLHSSVSFAFWGKNLGDKRYRSYAINLSEAFGYQYQVYGPPRSFGADIRWQF